MLALAFDILIYTLEGPRKFPLAQTESLMMKMRSVASDELHVMMQRRMSQESPSQATETELAQRLQRLTVLAVNRIIYQGKAIEMVFSSSNTKLKGK